MSARFLLRTIVVVAAAAVAAPLHAQPLPLKRTLAAGAAPGCARTPARPTTVRRDNAEVRRLVSQAQEAALIGDRAAARDAFGKAATLDRFDERLAYEYARASEEMNDTAVAVREYCRYLSLTPDGRDAGDVRARLAQLASRDAVQAAQRAQDRFTVGVTNYDRARYDIAWQAFDDAVRAAPGALEAVYNRGLSRAAINRREDAVRDLEAYLNADPAAADRLSVARAIETLRRPVFDAGTAMRLGLLPGFGQFYTRRAASGIVVLAAVAGATAAALHERVRTREVAYIDPNGVPVPYQEEYVERPYVVAGAATAAAIGVGAALEAYLYARRSKRNVVVEGPRGIGAMTLHPLGIDVSPFAGARSGVGLRFQGSF